MRYAHKNYTVEAIRIPAPDDDDMTTVDAWMADQQLTYKLTSLNGVEIRRGDGVLLLADAGNWIIVHPHGEIEVMFNHDFESTYRFDLIPPPKFIGDDDVYPLSLTKENFFNDLTAKYPSAMEEFCNWIDRYKGEVDWLVLFADHDYEPERGDGGERRQPKFNEIPIGMQAGVILEWLFTSKFGPQERGILSLGIEIGPPPTMNGILSYVDVTMGIINTYLTKEDNG